MKLTKIIVSALLVAAVALSMAACGGDSVTTTTVAGATTAGPKTTTKANVTTAATTTAAGATTTAGKDEWPKDVEPVWGGFWDVDENGVYTSYNKPEGNDFSILPVGAIEEGKTKYTISVKYIWDSKEKGILFGGKDVDGDGELREDFDWYQMILSNGYMAYCNNPGKWGDVWDTKDVSGAGLATGDEVKLTVILDTAANPVEGYLNDTFIGTWDINLEGYGIYFGIATKVVESKYWDIEFKAE